MAENEGGGDSKFLTGFLLGFLAGVLIALGVGASLVMVVGRRQAMRAEMAMREAEMAREEHRAMAEQALAAEKARQQALVNEAVKKAAKAKEVLPEPNVERDEAKKPEEEPEQLGEPQQELNDEWLAKFSRVILKDTEDVWTEQFRERELKYKPTTLVMFSGEVDTGCGRADSRVGPFYCPADRKVYLDLGFFGEMEHKLGVAGEFARTYVIAHEIAHHVQHLLGYSARADQMRGTPQEKQYSVRLELQADYLAGVWAHHLRKRYPDRPNLLTSKDAESGLNAAAKVGDDYLQKRKPGKIRVESFTHGTSSARAHWLKDGMKTGDFSKETLDAFFTLPIDKVVGLK